MPNSISASVEQAAPYIRAYVACGARVANALWPLPVILDARGDFCTVLEYHLCKAFENSGDNVLRYIGCDGVSEPAIEEQFTSRNITSIKQVITKAWMLGVRGSGPYDIMIKLGRRARRKALKGLSLEDCLPDAEALDWMEIDLENCWIVIQLN